MNVTCDVLTDLLPVYFSGEASEDTKRLVEEYFRENPDFERIARKAATSLEDLRMTAPVAPEAEREKYDLQWAREELFRRRVGFATALLFTLAPLMTLYRDGRLVWTAILNDPWLLALCWCIGAFLWFQYFARLSRRTSAMVSSIFFALLPLMVEFHLFLPGWQTRLSHRLAWSTAMWVGASAIWASYLWQSRKHRVGVP
jgi:hypothetical protein